MKRAARTVEKIVGQVHKEGVEELIPEVDKFVKEMRDKHIGVINIDYVIGAYLLGNYGVRTKQGVTILWRGTYGPAGDRNEKTIRTKLV